MVGTEDMVKAVSLDVQMESSTALATSALALNTSFEGSFSASGLLRLSFMYYTKRATTK